MFGITNQHIYRWMGLFGWFLHDISITTGDFYLFFFSFFYKITALIKRSIKQKNKENWNKTKQNEKIGFKREREIHFVPGDYWLHYRKRSRRPPKNVWKLLCRFNAVVGSNFILPKTCFFYSNRNSVFVSFGIDLKKVDFQNDW